MTVYVDILFVINFFITYLLLLFTKVMTKSAPKTARLLLASTIGALYSLTIFFDGLDFLITAFGKLAASALIVFAAFGFVRLTVYIKRLLIFYFSNFLFLGIIAGISLLSKSNAVKINGGSVYFDISAAVLVFSALAAYLVSVAVIWLYNRIMSEKEIYQLKIYKEGREYSLFAFLDSGNRLHEPFSGYPVIIADRDRIDEECERVIPYNTVGGEGMLKAFKPDRTEIITKGKTVVTERVYVALSEINSNDFSAILNEEILRGAL